MFGGDGLVVYVCMLLKREDGERWMRRREI